MGQGTMNYAILLNKDFLRVTDNQTICSQTYMHTREETPLNTNIVFLW